MLDLLFILVNIIFAYGLFVIHTKCYYMQYLNKNVINISTVDKISQLLNHDLNLVLVILKILTRVKYQNILRLVNFEPIFMLNMNFFQVLQWNHIFLWSLTLLYSLLTFLRRASEINDLCLFLWSHWFKTTIKTLKHLVLALVHVTVVFHQLWKNVFVCQNASFWYF